MNDSVLSCVIEKNTSACRDMMSKYSYLDSALVTRRANLETQEDSLWNDVKTASIYGVDAQDAFHMSLVNRCRACAVTNISTILTGETDRFDYYVSTAGTSLAETGHKAKLFLGFSARDHKLIREDASAVVNYELAIANTAILDTSLTTDCSVDDLDRFLREHDDCFARIEMIPEAFDCVPYE